MYISIFEIIISCPAGFPIERFKGDTSTLKTGHTPPKNPPTSVGVYVSLPCYSVVPYSPAQHMITQDLQSSVLFACPPQKKCVLVTDH